jgi:hypothetical protein
MIYVFIKRCASHLRFQNPVWLIMAIKKSTFYSACPWRPNRLTGTGPDKTGNSQSTTANYALNGDHYEIDICIYPTCCYFRDNALLNPLYYSRDTKLILNWLYSSTAVDQSRSVSRAFYESQQLQELCSWSISRSANSDTNASPQYRTFF